MGALHQISTTGTACGLLTIDLAAIVANWRTLAARAAPAECAAVVKADAYGLGAARVAPALARAGCHTFFVALPEEGIALRRLLGAGPDILVLHGPAPGDAAGFVAQALTPVLNSPAQAEAWAAAGQGRPAALQVDSGMARLGLAPPDAAALCDRRDLDIRLVLSHLACADDPADPANAAQLAAFRAARALFPAARASLAASFGIFLGPTFHFDLVRPGAALYGIAPTAGPNPMRDVVRLQAPVIQTRTVPAGTGIGYGHTARAAGPMRLATLGIGYADGLPRSLSNRGAAWFGDVALPIVGRISMDSTIVDAGALPGTPLPPGTRLDLIGPHAGVDTVAAQAGTVGYELLTRLGARFARRYVGVG